MAETDDGLVAPEDEAQVRADAAAITREMLAVIAEHQGRDPSAPRYWRYLAAHAVAAALLQMMRELLAHDTDAARARRFCAHLVRQLDEAASPPSDVVH
jgi:hypothetical protein